MKQWKVEFAKLCKWAVSLPCPEGIIRRDDALTHITLPKEEWIPFVRHFYAIGAIIWVSDASCEHILIGARHLDDFL